MGNYELAAGTRLEQVWFSGDAVRCDGYTGCPSYLYRKAEESPSASIGGNRIAFPDSELEPSRRHHFSAFSRLGTYTDPTRELDP